MTFRIPGVWDAKRALQHIGPGFLTVIPAVEGPTGGLVCLGLAFGFIAYEVMEALRLKDHAYKDIQGWLIGAYLAAVIVVCLRLFLL